MPEPQPFPVTAEMRQQCVDTLMQIVETGSAEDQIEAIRVLVEMVAQNDQAETNNNWLGKNSSN